MTNLMVNIDHVATLRNARRERFPDPVHAAVLCEKAGADGIVFHLREDRRHITERDVMLLKQTVQGRLDFELSTAPEIVSICCDVRPDLATLVPERREEVTTEGGLNLRDAAGTIGKAVTRLRGCGSEVSLFLNPVREDVTLARELGAQCVELHTGEYAGAETVEERERTLQALVEAAQQAHEIGLHVHAGHGLDYANYAAFRERVPHVREVSIGFAIVARAVLAGMEQAVREMRLLVKGY